MTRAAPAQGRRRQPIVAAPKHLGATRSREEKFVARRRRSAAALSKHRCVRRHPLFCIQISQLHTICLPRKRSSAARDEERQEYRRHASQIDGECSVRSTPRTAQRCGPFRDHARAPRHIGRSIERSDHRFRAGCDWRGAASGWHAAWRRGIVPRLRGQPYAGAPSFATPELCGPCHAQAEPRRVRRRANAEIGRAHV